MPKPKSPRRQRRPRERLANPVAHVLARITPLPERDRSTILLKVHDAMHKITSGQGDKRAWLHVSEALQGGERMDLQVYAGVYAQEFAAASAAHVACGLRFVQRGKMLYTGPELQAVNLALGVFGEQLAQATQAEVDAAMP